MTVLDSLRNFMRRKPAPPAPTPSPTSAEWKRFNALMREAGVTMCWRDEGRAAAIYAIDTLAWEIRNGELPKGQP